MAKKTTYAKKARKTKTAGQATKRKASKYKPTKGAGPVKGIADLRHPFEGHAALLLLSTPCKVSKAWLASDIPSDWESVLQTLPFEGDTIDFVLEHMIKMNGVKDAFALVAKQLKNGPYGGNEPHPDNNQAAAIINALKAIQ
jgi:hypothetical protein